MRQTHSFAVAMAAVLSTMVVATASARSLLCYYDFDTVDENGNIVGMRDSGDGYGSR